VRRVAYVRALVLALALAIGCEGVGRLDLTAGGRGRWQRPEDVVRALEIQPGDRVADLGAGDGYFVSHLSKAVGEEGIVYAVDVDAEIVEKLGETFPPDATNVETILGEYGDPLLPDGSIDLVLIVNTYHHIEDRPAYFRRLQRDLEPGGRVAVIDPNQDLGGLLGLTLDEGHKSSAAAVEAEMREAGYRVVARHEFLPVQIFRVFSPSEGG
jgi:ubiquinone/menaquinone biosynthesis C-methylase UbiE